MAEKDSDSLFEHDDRELTILGVQFDSQQQYRIAIKSLNEMAWAGLDIDKQDAIDTKQSLLGNPPTVQELLAHIKKQEKEHPEWKIPDDPFPNIVIDPNTTRFSRIKQWIRNHIFTR